MEEKDKIVKKIQKLLNLSGNNPNAAEAESAFLKAQELMLQHKIEESELNKDTKKTMRIISAYCEEPANTVWARQLARLLAKNFACMYYLNRTHKNSTVPTFFGEEEDAETCKGLYDYAVIWLNKSACNYATNMRNKFGIVKGVKQDYIVGFLKGLEDKFKEQTEGNAKYELMVIIPVEVKEAYNNLSLVTKSSNKSMKVHGCEEARQAGYVDGKGFGTDRLTKSS
jgi:hypothetical protein